MNQDFGFLFLKYFSVFSGVVAEGEGEAGGNGTDEGVWDWPLLTEVYGMIGQQEPAV